MWSRDRALANTVWTTFARQVQSCHNGSLEVIHILVYQGGEKSKRVDSIQWVRTFCINCMVIVTWFPLLCLLWRTSSAVTSNLGTSRGKHTASDRGMIIIVCSVPADRSFQILDLPWLGCCDRVRISSSLLWIDRSNPAMMAMIEELSVRNEV